MALFERGHEGIFMELINVEIDDTSVMQLEWAQGAIMKAFGELQPEGALGVELHRMTQHLWQWMLNHVHVVTGRLRASLYPMINFSPMDMWSAIGTNLSYAGEEAAREGAKSRGQPPYGGHDFIGRTVFEAGPGAMETFLLNLARSMQEDWDLAAGQHVAIPGRMESAEVVAEALRRSSGVGSGPDLYEAAGMFGRI